MRCSVLLTLIVGVFSALAEHSAPGQVVYTSARDYTEKPNYYTQLLIDTLEITTPTHGEIALVPYGQHMNQERQLRTVADGKADVMWTITTMEREALALPVKFPLAKGYFGKRVFVIHQDNQAIFPVGMSSANLKKRLAIQGLNWPDTRILSHNGYEVATVDWGNWFDNLFQVIRKKRGDYFPRSITEAPLELARLNDPALVIEKNHLLEYPAYMYFFVNPAKPWLMERLLDGLKKLESSGELEKLFFNYPENRAANEILKVGNRRIHKLKNPLISQTELE